MDKENTATTPISADQLDTIMAEAEQRVNNNVPDISSELEQKLQGCQVDLLAEYEETRFLFSVDGVPVVSGDDIHTIGAKQKAGKTSLVSIMLSAVVRGDWNRVKCLDTDLTALYIDTEMPKAETHKLGNKVAQMAGVTVEEVMEKVHFVNFRPLTPAEMEEGIRYFIATYHPGLVIIDGIVDLCANFNDVEASQNLVINFLMKTAEEHKCAVVSILHTNKSDGYSELRGHLGAFLEQKGATVIRCEKDEKSNMVTVRFATHRYAPVPDFHFTFSDDGTPVCADTMYQELEQEKQLSQDERNEAERLATYTVRSQIIVDILRANGGSMERKSLAQAAMERMKRKEGVFKAVVKQMMEANPPLITQTDSIVKLS